MKFDIIDQKGKKTDKKVELEPTVFEAKINNDLEAQAIKVYLYNVRKLTHSTKTRGEVRGGGIKPWKQKGTGRARAGSRRSPIWIGGGITFGPRPSTKKLKLLAKMRKGAIRSALSRKVKAGGLTVVDQIKLPEKQLTKAMLEVAISVTPKTEKQAKVTFIIGQKNENLSNAARNISWIKVMLPEALNIYELTRADHLVFLEDSISEVNKVWKPRSKKS